MVYDEELLRRVNDLIGDEPGLSEKRMFGGHGFLLEGNLAVAVSSRGGLLVRVDPGEGKALAGEDGASPMEMRGAEVAGWMHVEGEALREDDQLETWVQRGVDRARSLPPKD